MMHDNPRPSLDRTLKSAMSPHKPMFAEMFVAEDADPRTDVPTRADEKAMLAAFLRWQRQTLMLKCADLDPQAMAQRSVPFSGLSLLGLVRHLADIERRWFRRDMAGHAVDPHFGTEDHPDAAFDDAASDAETVAQAWRLWQEKIDFADRFVAEAANLEVTCTDPWRGTITLRWVLVHLVEEYARHNGHADFLRQGIDGAVGV
ncbi:DinB family protein [Nonomuraea dietziae]|uniref:DinB family protein n=1 Tax=Nonomuraea dietziae TaxID=65515 RepID=UPI0033C48A6C